MSTVSLNSTGAIPVFLGPQTTTDIQKHPASQAQLEVWLSSLQSAQANCAYNQISSLVFNGQLDTGRIKEAIDKIVQRHASLRSTFSADGQEVIVHQSKPYQFEERDLSQQSPEEQHKSMLSVIQEQARTPFDLIDGPLLRVVLQKLSNSEHKLTFTVHHAVLDGWSIAVFCHDLGYFYDSLSGIEREPLEPASQYSEYAELMDSYYQSENGQGDEAFWVSQFEDRIPVLDLPTEYARPSLRTYSGARYDHRFPAELVEKVRQVGIKSGCSLFNVMLAGFNAYIARITGNDDFCIGIPTAGQAAMDRPRLIGHCVNTIPLRTQVDINESFVGYMKTSRTTLLNAFDHQRYSYGTLLRKLARPRDPSRAPMLNVSFNIDPIIDVNKLGFPDLDVEIVIEPRSFENFEWFVNGVIQKDKSIELQAQYNTDLYTAELMQSCFEGFAAFLEDVAAEPNRKIADFHCLSIPQRQQVVVDWNATELEYPVESTLHREFARQARQTPDKIAVKFADASLTYSEVEARSNQIARHLVAQGISPGDLVGICVERSEQMLVNLFAILKCGAGYVPLDPSYPSDRLQYMCDHSGLKLVVTERNLRERVSEFNKPKIAIDEFSHQISTLDSSPLENKASPVDTCYVIYTSGSTGKPKGVQVPHGAVVNFLYSMKKTPGFTKDDSVLAVTTLSFDIAVLELYLPTVFGGTVVILDSMTAADGVQLAQQIEQHEISVLQATPATWRLLIQAGWKGNSALKALCGGEPMPSDLVGGLLDRCGELWNMYGPTETTVWSAAYQITNADAPILIGKPIGNTQIYILDANGNEVPIGCEGEVYIGGAGVTLGYLHREDLTDERFLESRYRNPFKNFVSDKIYRTGDLARYRFDGNIQFLRRNDKQVKVRGFRIELGEIEQNLNSHPAIQQSVVIVREDTPGDARLVAYVVPRSGTVVAATELRDHIRKSLPHYMVPQHIVSLQQMPLTNNGKIDHKALPAPSVEAAPETSEIALPTTPAEKYLASVWQEVLELDDIGINDTFFDIGGHSLLVMQVIAQVQQKTGIRLGPQEFLTATLEQMADKLSGFEEFAEVAGTDADSLLNNRQFETASQSTEEADVVHDTASEAMSEAGQTKASSSVFRTLKGFWD